MKSIAYLTNAAPESGVGYRATKIYQSLIRRHQPELDLEEYLINGAAHSLSRGATIIATQRRWPKPLDAKTISWVYLGRQLRSHLRQRPHVIWHATNQTLSFITAGHHPSVVTVHDLIELQEPQSLFGAVTARYLYRGIRRADQVIAVSAYTAAMVEKIVGISATKISIIPNGADDDFYPIPNYATSIGAQSLRQELQLQSSQIIVLLVSSDHPRKNSLTALRAFAQARRQDPRLVLVKVGAAGLPAGRLALLEEIDRLRLRQHVRLLQNISNERLNELYNAAALLIFPSRFEGFGLPPLQAMAAGTPVVASRATSVPEVVGSAGILHSPDDVDAFAQSITEVIQDTDRAQRLRAAGLVQARKFSWDHAADAEASLYQRL